MAALITGLGAVSSLGRGTARVWSAMAEGWDGLEPIRRFDPQPFGATLAGMVPDRNTPAFGADSAAVSCVEFAVAAAREAWDRAGLGRVARDRIAFVFGSSLGDPDLRIHEITERVADVLGIAGPRVTVSTACASSANALGIALDLLAMGAADAVIAGGADVLTPLVLAGFNALGVLATGKCAPFSEPAGTTLGEGAGFIVLERAEQRPGLAILGYGLAADGFHDTGPDPSGAGVARAIRAALDHAGVAAESVDYINAHGTGTRANDPAEWRAIQHVFGGRAEAIPVSASKSFLGHAQGAAGVLETIATIVALEHGTIPPTQRFTVARPNSPRDPVGQATARAATCNIALATSAGFGGANCTVVIGRARPPAPTARREVSISGCGAIGPHGTTLDELVAGGMRGRARAFRFEALVPSADPRGLDPSTRYLTGAVALALADAHLRLRASDADRSGLVLGVTAMSAESERALQQTIAAHGYRGLSASMFARQVVNAPAGTCARLLGLRGAHSTVAAGPATGLLAFVYAAELLASHRDCDRIVAAAVDELPAEVGDGSDGAVAGVLCASPGAVRVAGWHIAGPGRIAEAAASALATADLDEVDVMIGPPLDCIRFGRRIDPAALVGESPCFTSGAGVVIGARLVATGQARHVVVAGGGASADCAIVLTRGEAHAS
ncbi:MAG: putative beta-ketoacyl synthase [Myxococcales bacterium]|nr:putative beta-ketoacyl synthase [Myxococcales bacterium]